MIEWLEEWPSSTVPRQLPKIIELTGPLDKPLSLSETQTNVFTAYVRYTRTKLTFDRSRDTNDSFCVKESSTQKNGLGADQ